MRSAASDRYAQAVLRNVCAEVAGTTSGRNAKLNGAAFALGRLVGGGHLGKHEVEEALFDAATACAYVQKDGPAQARATIRSGLDRGILEPRDPPAADDARSYRPPDPKEVARIERARLRQQLAREAEDKSREERARRAWAEADSRLWETLARPYYVEHRGLAQEMLSEIAGHAVRFTARGPWRGDRAPMVLDAFRDFTTNDVVGLRRTRLDPVTAQKVDRKMLGRAAGAAIKLSPDSDVGAGLCVAEGTETAIAGMMLGLRPMWALGSSGGIKALPLLPHVTALTICAEVDDGGANARAIEECGNRWSDAGREVLIATPKIGGDLNDAVKGATL